ncbi:unnamed protein product [Rangifer tarandus platyrhynchus]|uniref:Uncharacterized protein n=2 Tax=Rangifer tarandus platyrhynchus TaxID=3082113 RepID=A0ABN8ZQB5_RANTA|nr:unnamed protein product [Rangifer tarandus platyrhynchus]CAI9709671.1 unnamed protein product [Rangifer tarandus platyrhynchus]
MRRSSCSIHPSPAADFTWAVSAHYQVSIQPEPVALAAASAATTVSAPHQPNAVPLGADWLPGEGRPAPWPRGSGSLRRLHAL